jgi:tripartite-type tricarboxylate transporter receptor subunit TctC
MQRRRVLIAASLAPTLGAPFVASAQSYPSRPIKLITGFTPGGVADLVSRAIADRMAISMGQPVVVDARPGASGMIGHDAIVKAEPDGYTFGLIVSPVLIAGMVNGRAWNLDAEMAPLGLAYRQGYMIGLNPTVPEFRNVKNMMDLVGVVKANPEKIFYASVSTGSTGHLTGALIGAQQGLKWEHVAYKGMQGPLLEMVAGRTPLVMFGTAVEDPDKFPGKVINIASSALKRNPTSPNVPTLDESGFPGLDASTWAGFFAPMGIAKPVMDKLVAEYKAAWEHPDTQARLSKSLVLEYAAPAEFMTIMKGTVSTWGPVIKKLDLKS